MSIIPIGPRFSHRAFSTDLRVTSICNVCKCWSLCSFCTHACSLLQVEVDFVKAGKHARARQVDIDKGVSYYASGGWLKYVPWATRVCYGLTCDPPPQRSRTSGVLLSCFDCVQLCGVSAIFCGHGQI